MSDVATRREKRGLFPDKLRLELAEDDLDEKDRQYAELRQAISKLTAAALGLLVSVVVCTLSVLLTVAVTR